MSRRRTAEIVASVIQAFLEDGTWKQAELARRASATTETIRKTLEDMRAAGWPLEREEDPPQVYWSLPQGWLPPGMVLPMERVATTLRLLARLPADGDRDGLIGFLTSASPGDAHPSFDAWHQPKVSSSDARRLGQIEDAIRDGAALGVRYYSAHRGVLESRVISFQRITRAQHVRMCGHCHRDDRLKWFRLDHVHEIEGPADEAFVEHAPSELDAFVSTTVLGFHSAEDARPASFVVRMPEARWIQDSLPKAMRAEPIDGGIRVHVEAVSLQQVARYVLNLAGAARPETEALAQAVRALAKSALEACDPDGAEDDKPEHPRSHGK